VRCYALQLGPQMNFNGDEYMGHCALRADVLHELVYFAVVARLQGRAIHVARDDNSTCVLMRIILMVEAVTSCYGADGDLVSQRLRSNVKLQFYFAGCIAVARRQPMNSVVA